jgi:rhomboid family GlyGly-CTERM serine protease
VNKGVLGRLKGVAEWRPRRFWPLVVIGLASLGLALGGEELRLLGRYDRTGLAEGEYWRLVTAHLVHLSWGHLGPNLAALALIGALFERAFTATDWLVVGLASALAIDAGLYFVDPNVDWYVGLSGVLHGFVAAGGLALLLRGESLGAVLAIGLCAKLVWEQQVGPMPFTASAAGGDVIVAAHLYGSAGGLAAAAALAAARRARSWL